MDDSILKELLNRGDTDDPYCVKTNLPSLSGKSKIICNIDWMSLPRIENKLSWLKSITMSKNKTEWLQLLDEYQSATIEGAKTTIDSVQSGGTEYSDIMVRQSLHGLQYMLDNYLNEDSLMNCWKVVVHDCCGNYQAGVNGYRSKMVYVGNSRRIVHVPAAPEEIQPMMTKMFEYTSESKLIEAIIRSFYLVYIHPFADGNGRLSRILIKKELGIQALPLSKAISNDLYSYYDTLRRSEKELNDELDITPYGCFIMKSIEEACDALEMQIKPLTDIQNIIITEMKNSNREFIGYKDASELVKCSFETAMHIVNELIDLGYLEYSENAGAFKLIWRG